MSGDFNPEQKRYLEGFVAGLQIAKAARGSGGAPSSQGTAVSEPGGTLTHKAPEAGKMLDEGEVAALFGIEIAAAPEAPEISALQKAKPLRQSKNKPKPKKRQKAGGAGKSAAQRTR